MAITAILGAGIGSVARVAWLHYLRLCARQLDGRNQREAALPDALQNKKESKPAVEADFST